MPPKLKIHQEDDTREVSRQEAVLEELRAKCMSRMRTAASMAPNVLGKADVDIYEEEVISDEGFAKGGITDTALKIQYIKENINVNIPKLVVEAKSLESEFRSKMDEAKKNGWINDKTVNDWYRRLKSEHVYLWKKKSFIKPENPDNPHSLPAFLKNWKSVAEAREKLMKEKTIKQLKASDVPQIGVFRNKDQFLNLSYEARKALIATVTAAVAAKDRQMPKLFTQARGMLEGAAKNQILSWNKVGSWLQRIFTSNAKPEQIEDFLNNKGKDPLQKLIERWAEATKDFQKIEAKRKSLGTPPGFHFVKMNVFLNWHYNQRTSYLQEAKGRFGSLRSEPELFSKIRHEMGAQDWEAAAELMDEAKGQQWGEVDQQKLRTMELFLKFHRHEDAKKKPEQSPSDEEIVSEAHLLIAQLPPQMQHLYTSALKRGYQAFWVLTTLMYNRHWCWQHNFLDDSREKEFEQKAKHETRDHIEQGHKKYGLEVNSLRQENTDAAVRDQSGVRGAQILYTDERSSESLLKEIDEQKNSRDFWYWTSMIPRGVEYSEHVHIVQDINPRLKKLARMMDQRGMRYGGAPQKAKAA